MGVAIGDMLLDASQALAIPSVAAVMAMSRAERTGFASPLKRVVDELFRQRGAGDLANIRSRVTATLRHSRFTTRISSHPLITPATCWQTVSGPTSRPDAEL